MALNFAVLKQHKRNEFDMTNSNSQSVKVTNRNDTKGKCGRYDIVNIKPVTNDELGKNMPINPSIGIRARKSLFQQNYTREKALMH